MNYQRIHDAIIDRARNRTLQGYREKHHVIPRCMGGIRVKPTQLIKQKQPISPERFAKALDAIKAGKFDKEQLIKDYVLTEEQIEQL